MILPPYFSSANYEDYKKGKEPHVKYSLLARASEAWNKSIDSRYDESRPLEYDLSQNTMIIRNPPGKIPCLMASFLANPNPGPWLLVQVEEVLPQLWNIGEALDGAIPWLDKRDVTMLPTARNCYDEQR